MTKSLNQKDSMSAVVEAGDFCFDSTGRVIISCPSCAVVFLCRHEVIKKDPLTLSPSVKGPDDQVLSPCMHHFWIVNGKAVGINEN